MTEPREDPALELARKIVDRVWYGNHRMVIDDVAALLRPHVWEWIPVEERLPEKPGWYLACHKTIADGTPVRRSWFDGEWFKMNQITHWTSLPSAPLSLESSNQK